MKWYYLKKFLTEFFKTHDQRRLDMLEMFLKYHADANYETKTFLDAADVMRRFDELYKYLGVYRSRYTSEAPKLIKRKKNEN